MIASDVTICPQLQKKKSGESRYVNHNRHKPNEVSPEQTLTIQDFDGFMILIHCDIARLALHN
jgi:hypothetical protein